jgi:hypothetical protein
MRLISIVFFMLLAAFSAQVLAQGAAPTPQKPAEVTYEEILKKFRFRAYPKQPDAEINKETTDAIAKRGLWYVLSDKDRKELMSAGASADLISAIDEAVPEFEKKRLGEIIHDYKVILDNWSLTDAEHITRFISACKDFLKKVQRGDKIKTAAKMDLAGSSCDGAAPPNFA